MDFASLGEKLRSVLNIYYDWVSVSPTETGLSVRVGRSGIDDTDVSEFMSRVKGEAGESMNVEVKVDKERGEISGIIALGDGRSEMQPQNEAFRKLVADFGEAVRLGTWEESADETNSSVRLSKIQDDVPAFKVSASVTCADDEDILRRADAACKFLEERGFKMFSEGAGEDTLIREDGSLAWLNLVRLPKAAPFLKMSVYVPKTMAESSRLLHYHGLQG